MSSPEMRPVPSGSNEASEAVVSDSPARDGFTPESIQFIQQLINIDMRGDAGVPSPAALAAFEQIQPGLANRLVGMAEREQKHRHRVQSIGVWGEVVLSVAGLVFAFILALVLIGASAYLIKQGHDAAGATVGSGTVVALATIFIVRGRQEAQPDTEPKKKKRN